MAVLTGKEIKKRLNKDIFITEFDEKRLNPNSYNLRLHNELMVYENDVLDMKAKNPARTFEIPPEGFILQPGEFYLGRTVERTKTLNLLPMLEGRSSIARLGMTIHITAGFGDCGFNGTWTLEIKVEKPLKIYPYVEICQVYYQELIGEIVNYKKGKYQGNHEIQASMLYKDFEQGKF